jgi:hypothetical protein
MTTGSTDIERPTPPPPCPGPERGSDGRFRKGNQFGKTPEPERQAKPPKIVVREVKTGTSKIQTKIAPAAAKAAVKSTARVKAKSGIGNRRRFQARRKPVQRAAPDPAYGQPPPPRIARKAGFRPVVVPMNGHAGPEAGQTRAMLRKAKAKAAIEVDEGRRALAAAISEAETAHATLAKRKATLAKLKSAVYGGQGEIEAADKAIAEARTAYDIAVERAIEARKVEPSTDKLDAARIARAGVEERHRSRRKAFDNLVESTKEMEKNALDADMMVDAAVMAVYAPIVEGVIRKLAAIEEQSSTLRDLLESFVRQPDRPTQPDAITRFHQARIGIEPLRQKAVELLIKTKISRTVHPDPWISTMGKLREDSKSSIDALAIFLEDADGKPPWRPRKEEA